MARRTDYSGIKPDVKNANKGTERGRYMVEASLRETGAGRSILLDKDGRIIAGNKTFEAASDIGLPVRVVETDGTELVAVKRTDLDLDDDTGTARKLAYYDNRASEISLSWDAEQMLADLGAGLDLSAMFKQDELDELLADLQPKTTGDTPAEVDRAEELRQKWGAAPGQLWQLGEHRLICGDCTDPATVARVMGGERAALMATDPPYGVAYTVETGVGSKFGAIANDENDGPRLQAFLESAFGAAKTALLDNAAWYLWHAQMTQGFFAAAAAAAAAVIIHRQIIWVKPSLILGHGDYHWRHELCFYGWVEGHRPPWYGDRKQTTVWEIGRENDGVHPTQKPIEIFERPLQFNTCSGDIAYEPFCGSGSQIIACENLSRRCRAVEISPAYVAVALERWATHTGKTPVLVE